MTGEYRLVPVKPTPAMVQAGAAKALSSLTGGNYTWDAYISDLYGLMLAAAPQPEHVNEGANPLTSTPVDVKKSGFSDIKLGPPADLVERAREWSARALIAEARAEAAERESEEKTIAYSRAMESRQHWRERAEVAERTMSDLIKAALAEEREACAKVAEAEDEFGWSI